MIERLNAEYVRKEKAEQALELLIQSARISPPLRDAVEAVEGYLRYLERTMRQYRDHGWVGELDKQNERMGAALSYLKESRADAYLEALDYVNTNYGDISECQCEVTFHDPDCPALIDGTGAPK